ncbi:hypothetical protein CRG98_013322 [Punica granatum]|uniref:Uncharacterized protein n=1 Tax=Punica granatum TaxID=22663 RepID=A0A2I0KEQ7_PUNGR|nr:hypothetical protein CRG98_013322 [Punica granatum]
MVDRQRDRVRGTENGKGFSSRLRRRAQGRTHQRTVGAPGNSKEGVQFGNKLRNERTTTASRVDTRVLVNVHAKRQGASVHCRCGAELEVETIVAALLVAERGGIEVGSDLRKEREKP